MRNVVIKKVENRFVEKRNFLINISVRRSFLTSEIVNC